MESAWSTSWKQSMFHEFKPGRHLWILAGCLDVNPVTAILVCVYIVCFRVTHHLIIRDVFFQKSQKLSCLRSRLGFHSSAAHSLHFEGFARAIL